MKQDLTPRVLVQAEPEQPNGPVDVVSHRTGWTAVARLHLIASRIDNEAAWLYDPHMVKPTMQIKWPAHQGLLAHEFTMRVS